MTILSSLSIKKSPSVQAHRRSSDPYIFDITQKKALEIKRPANINELKDHYKDGFQIKCG